MNPHCPSGSPQGRLCGWKRPRKAGSGPERVTSICIGQRRASIAATSLKPKGFAKPLRHAREIIGLQRPQHAFDEILLHPEEVRDAGGAWVVKPHSLPVLQRIVPGAGSLEVSRLAA